MIISPSGETTIAVEWSLAAVALIFVLLRIWVRVVKLRNRLILADYLVVAGWFLQAAYSTCDTAIYLGGGMQRGTDIRTIHFPERLLKLAFASGALFYLGILLPRFSIAALYLTLFLEGTALRKALYVVIVYMGLCTLTTLVVLASYCRPISANWTPGPDLCSVVLAAPPFAAFWAIILVCDVALFALPFFLLQTLTLRRSQQFGLIAIFLVGFTTIAVSVARYSVTKVSKDISTICIWSSAEFACSIIVACLPNLKVFLQNAISMLRNTGNGRGADKDISSPSNRSKTKAFPFSDLFSSHDHDSAIRENRSTISTRFSSILDQFVDRQNDQSASSPRAREDSPIIPSFNKDIFRLSEAESHSVSNLELSNIEQHQQGRRPSELTILKTNDVQFDVHIHSQSGENSCERRAGGNDSRNNPPPCATVEYVPGGKSPFETKVWV